MSNRSRLRFAPFILLLVGCLLMSMALVLQTTPASSAATTAEVSDARSSSLVLDAPPPYCPHVPGDNPGGSGELDRDRPCGPKVGKGPGG